MFHGIHNNPLWSAHLNIGNSNLHLNTRLNSDGGDLLDNLRGTVQVDHSLVHTQLKPIPGVGTCEVTRFTS